MSKYYSYRLVRLQGDNAKDNFVTVFRYYQLILNTFGYRFWYDKKSIHVSVLGYNSDPIIGIGMNYRDLWLCLSVSILHWLSSVSKLVIPRWNALLAATMQGSDNPVLLIICDNWWWETCLDFSKVEHFLQIGEF